MRHAHALTMQRLESDSALYSVEGVSSYRPHPVSRESSLSHTRAYRVAVPSQRYTHADTHTDTSDPTAGSVDRTAGFGVPE